MPTPLTGKEEPKRARNQTSESKVLHVRALPTHATEQEVVDVVKQYGNVTKVLILPDKNQAFVEMQDATQAAAVLAGLEHSYPTIRNKRVYWQYSDRDQVEAKTAVYVTDNRVTGDTQASLESVGSTVILLAISECKIPVSLEALQQIGSSFGTIYRIITFTKGSDFHALLEFSSPREAAAAKEALDFKDLYENCCHIRASFSNKQTLQVKTNDHRSWDYTLQLPSLMPFAAFYGMGFDGAGGAVDPSTYQQFPSQQQSSISSSSTSSATITTTSSSSIISTSSSPYVSMHTPNFPPGALSFAAVAAGNTPFSSSSPSTSTSSQTTPLPSSSTSAAPNNQTNLHHTHNGTTFPPAQASIPPSTSPSGALTLNMIDCFGSQPFQGQPTAIITLESQKSFDDRNFLTQLSRELNVLVILLIRSPSLSVDRSEFSVCWTAPGWGEGEDPHCLSVALSASHSLFSSKRASRFATLLPRSGNQKIISTREEVGASRVVWLTVNLSPLDAFTDEPWYRSEQREKSKGLRFVQGLKIDLDKVVSVERNGYGVVVVQVSDEASVLRFSTKFLPPALDRVSVLIVTAGCSSRQWQQDAFDSTSRVFGVDPLPPFGLMEDCGGGAGGVALACYWFPRTSKLQSAFRNPSSRPGVICTRLQPGPSVANLPFDRVEVGGQAVITMVGELTI